MEFSHVSVLLAEAIDALAIDPRGTYVDCTAGGGGHSFEIASRLDGGRLISIDRDSDAVGVVTERLAKFGDSVTVVRRNYGDVASVLDELAITEINGILWDLGVSSYQLDEAERGFSYMADAPLDMRMDRSAALSAYDVVNSYPELELCRVIYEYGEEKFAGRIARRIVERREEKPIETTLELSGIIENAIPEKNRRTEHKHPAKRTFQAIRIEVNGELSSIAPSIEAGIERLVPGGRAAVITFHSLEDRIVKNTFADAAKGCICPPDFPVCVCGVKPKVRLVSKKPILPSEEELRVNPRARSAKLRVAEKL